MTNQEQIINDPRYIPIYEHGFVGLIETMGSDSAICQAARVSYGTGTKSVSDDRNLIRYLVRHKHTSPLEMAEVKFHVKLPIFVMRQLVRHRTANLNEYSARYSVLSDEFYVPTDAYLAPQSTTNKQGRAGELRPHEKVTIKTVLKMVNTMAYRAYSFLLGETKEPLVGFGELGEDFPGLSRELARTIMPVSNYTECFWKCDLHNFFHFCRLRMDSHAQQEIQDFAKAMYDLAKPHFPEAAQAFEDYIFNSKTLSAMDIRFVKDIMTDSIDPDPAYYGMSKREYAEAFDFWITNR
jgi:thymidylate synthase (FAD)